MSRLVPQKRVDRNGRLVTRHVLADGPDQRRSGALPPPSLGMPAKPASPKPLKPRPSQLVPRAIRFQCRNEVNPSWSLRDKAERDAMPAELVYSLTASEVEMYSVASACEHDGDAIKLLSLGVRSAAEATEHLDQAGLRRLAADRTELTDAALAAGLTYEQFLVIPEFLFSGRPTEDIIGAIRLRNSPLGLGFNGSVATKVLEGKISFDDIKAVGIGRLKSRDKLHALSPVFAKLHEGAAGFSVEGIKSLIDRAAGEQFISNEYRYLAALASAGGLDRLLECPSMADASRAFLDYVVRASAGRGAKEDAIERTFYAAHFKAAIPGRRIFFEEEFYDAGIPVETAIEVVAAGGGLREAIAIHNEGIAGGLAGGHL